ncbi:MAG TPA: protein kinase [Hyalangium sp.]|nr:protein kinase [Hyalangium sp.]
MIERDASAGGAPPNVVDPLLGRVLNERFKILEALGAGGMGRVYKAIQAPLDRPVALKILNPQYGQDKDPGFQKRFFFEASVTSKLRHPNTVTVIDYGKTEDGIYFIAMEYLEGQTLSQLLTTMGPLPWPRALNIVQQIARSLREAHKIGLIHRDLKPANVMILNQETDHDVVKVLDFGLVKSFMPDSAQLPVDVSLTQAGVILGSPQYMAPEQARNTSDPRSDVYSLGVVLYQMLVGRPPFHAEQGIDIIVKHINEPPPAFAAFWPEHNIPPEVEALVMKCLAKRPADRFESMSAVLDAVRRALSSASISGAFATPISYITAINTGPITGPVPQHHPTGVSPEAATESLDISENEAGTGKRRNSLPMALFGAAVLIGVTVALVLALRSPAPKPVTALPTPLPMQPAPSETPGTDPTPGVASQEALPIDPEELPTPSVEPTEAVKAKPGLVRFLITSEPRGARVTYAGKSLGTTPVQLEVPAGDSGRARAELTFDLGGYTRTTVTAEGKGPEVRFTQRLKKKGSRPSRPSGSNGYKDDPYQ